MSQPKTGNEYLAEIYKEIEEAQAKKEKDALNDMPPADEVIQDDGIVDSVDDDNEKRLDESDKEENEERQLRRGPKRAAKKEGVNCKENGEEEVMAEIGRKITNTGEKAKKMRRQKVDDKQKKREEMEKKKECDKRAREEKKRKKLEEKELEGKPRSRAEAARRTKSLLGLGRGGEEIQIVYEEEDEPTRKKRKYTKRTSAVPFARKINDEDEDEAIVSGMYIYNPRILTMKDLFSSDPLEEEDEEEEGDVDGILSVPALSMSDTEETSANNYDPYDIDDTCSMKKHMHDVREQSGELAKKCAESAEILKGLEVNLFADTTVRRFDPRVVHNIDYLTTSSFWPVDLLPQPGLVIPKYQSEIWNRPFGEMARIRPTQKIRDERTSKHIDEICGGEKAENVNSRGVVRNLADLVISKLEKSKKWKPLPRSNNPFDVPEISTRSMPARACDYTVSSYVTKSPVIRITTDSIKRKKTRKQILAEAVNKPKPAEEERTDKGIYNEDHAAEAVGDEDRYQFAWDEMGEMMQNPMRDNYGGDNPFPDDALDGVVLDLSAIGVRNGSH